jgi:ABC-type multidrug transport system permease subunit
MYRDALYLARKDLWLLFRERHTWVSVFVMPIVFFYFIGTVTGGFSRPGPSVERVGLYAPDKDDLLAGQLQRRLEAQGYKVDRVDEQKLPSYTRRIRVPVGFTDSVLAGHQAVLKLSRTGGGLGADYDEIRVKRTAYSVLADLIVATKDGAPPTGAALEKLVAAPRAITLSVVPAGKRKTIPGGFQQAVPGTMVMFLLLVMFTTGGISLQQERTLGILRRLASTPMSRGAVVLGKWSSRFVLGMIQTAFAMLAGTLLFRVDWGANLPAVLALLLAYAALAASAGMLLGNFGKTEGQVIGLGVITSNVLAMAGGCWWPAEITPLWAQKLGLLIPTGWAMNGLHRLISFGDSPMAVVPHIAAMVAAALAAGWILAKKFRFQ